MHGKLLFEKIVAVPDSRWKLVSIRTLCGEGDPLAPRSTLTRKLFLSTPSARRATDVLRCRLSAARNFYPRPPRGGRLLLSSRSRFRTDFYPRPPRGGRRPQWCRTSRRYGFLSTPSARRATGGAKDSTDAVQISIHALREEGDPRRCRSGSYGIPISIHALREEGDGIQVVALFAGEISIHALREEGDNFRQQPQKGRREFLSTPSARRATHQP